MIQKYRVSAYKNGTWSWRHLSRNEAECTFTFRKLAKDAIEALVRYRGFSESELRVETV